jgi:hypothetical protein
VRCIVVEHGLTISSSYIDDQEKKGCRLVPGLTHLVWILFDYTLIFICVTHGGCAQSTKLQQWEDRIIKIVGTSLTRLVTIHSEKLKKLIFESPKKNKALSVWVCRAFLFLRTLSI